MQRIAAGLLIMAVLAGCTEPGGPTATERSASRAAESSGGPSATAAPSPTRPSVSVPEERVPLAFVVRATRTVAEISRRQARELVAGSVSRWSQLGQPGGRLQVLRPDPADASAIDRALRRVRGDERLLTLVPAGAVDATVRTLTVNGISPLRFPRRYWPTTGVPAAQETEPTVTTLAAVGDIMLGRRVAATVRDDPTAVFGPLATRLTGADLTLGNFESTLSDNGSPTQGGDSFAADPGVLPALESAGFDLLQLANNHLGDYGEGALLQTLDRFDAAGLPTVGAGRNLAQARRPVVLEREGVRFGFLACDSIGETPAATVDGPGANRLDMPPRTGPLDRSDLRRIAADVAALDERVDVVVVLAHWGTQYTHEPEPSQRRAARVFADAGADLIIGGHPHWVQGLQLNGAAVTVHSLGNFVFDMDFSAQTMQGVLIEAVFWDGRLMGLEPVPYELDSRFVPRPAGRAAAAEILDDLWSSSRPPFDH